MSGPLTGMRVALRGTSPALWHAGRLLTSLGAATDSSRDAWRTADGVLDEHGGRPAGVPSVHVAPATALGDWAASGAMALTGRRDGPALRAPGQAASVVRGVLLATELLARIGGAGATLPDARVLSERAAVAGFRRNAPASAGGAFRVLRAAEGWLGVNLARESDVELLPAWLETAVPAEDPWPVLAEIVGERDAEQLAERARLLGLPIASWSTVDGATAPFALTGRAANDGRWEWRPPLVVDLSSLWAGPLCGHLLTTLGARVVKVESVHRPDGARFGPRGFYDLLHAGQESVALDFATPAGRAALAGLVEAADVVIEGSRPRALRQLGVDADAILARAGDKCWIGITAYGRTGPWSNAVAFGDDAALAGGLLAFDPETGTAAPCGDAIADPLTGVNAALAAVACRLAGGHWMVDLALRDQAAATLVGSLEDDPVSAAPPRIRPPAGPAPQLGAHTKSVLAELGLT